MKEKRTVEIDIFDKDVELRPVYRQMQEIKVAVCAHTVAERFCRDFIAEAQRCNPLKFDVVKLTEEEMIDYTNFLLNRRVASVTHSCKDWRQLKSLWMPSFIQFVLRCLGEVIDYKRGRHVTLCWRDTTPEGEPIRLISLQEAMKISDKIRAFQDELNLVDDAMPRGTEGLSDVMSCVELTNQVCSSKEMEHAVSEYVCAFAHMQLEKELSFAALYEIRYDDIDFIAMTLTQKEGVF